jgi:hypothetical protein
MTPQEHYDRAEALLAEGAEVVGKIASASDDYHPYGSNGGMTHDAWVRARRDDLGKKAMGIWAQAQVHATLAIVRGLCSVKGQA